MASLSTQLYRAAVKHLEARAQQFESIAGAAAFNSILAYIEQFRRQGNAAVESSPDLYRAIVKELEAHRAEFEVIAGNAEFEAFLAYIEQYR